MSAYGEKRPQFDSGRTPRPGDVPTHRLQFTSVFSIVGIRSHSPEQDSCYKFRDRWIPVALPQPTLTSQNALHGSWPPQKGQESLDFAGPPKGRYSVSRALPFSEGLMSEPPDLGRPVFSPTHWTLRDRENAVPK